MNTYENVIKFVLSVAVVATMLAGFRQCIRAEADECERNGGYYFSGSCLHSGGNNNAGSLESMGSTYGKGGTYAE